MRERSSTRMLIPTASSRKTPSIRVRSAQLSIGFLLLFSLPPMDTFAHAAGQTCLSETDSCVPSGVRLVAARSRTLRLINNYRVPMIVEAQKSFASQDCGDALPDISQVVPSGGSVTVECETPPGYCVRYGDARQSGWGQESWFGVSCGGMYNAQGVKEVTLGR
jgi:hypothetical protein